MLTTSKDKLNILDGQVLLIQKEKQAIASERDASIAKVSRLRTLLNRYRAACRHVARRLNEEGLPLRMSHVASENQAKDEVSLLLRGFHFYMNDCEGQHIARTRSFFSESSSTIMEVLRNMGEELHDIVYGYSVSSNHQFDVTLVFPSSDVIMLPWINTAPGGDSSAVAETVEIQPFSSLRL